MKMIFLINTAEFIYCESAFVLGVLLFLAGFIYILSKKGLREEHFAIAALFEFFSSWVLYIPVEFFNDIPGASSVLKVLESIFTALLRTFNIYQGNGYERNIFEGYPVFSSVYALLMVLANIVLLLFVVGFIAKFLDGPFQRIKLSRRKKRYSFIFISANEKSLAIAESINSQKRNIIFTNADKNIDPSVKQKITAISGILSDMSLGDTIRKISSKSEGIEVFIFSNNEQDNLAELENLNDILIGEKVRIKNQLRIFIELSDTPWSLYDEYLKRIGSEKGEKVIINFVRSEENFIYNNLLKNSIFENALEVGKTKMINLLLVGMNERNLEMFKASLFLGQMPGYRLNLMIIDEGNNRKMLRQKFPEIYDESDKEGDAIYKIIYCEAVDTATDDFENIITENFFDFTFAFINVGDDLKNVNIAMRLRAACYRKNRREGYKIQVSIKNRDIPRNWQKELLNKLDFVGAVKDIYNYNFITMSDIETGTREIHKVRYPEGIPTWLSYCNNEYNRHSVYARTLSFKHKVWILDKYYDGKYELTSSDGIWGIYEHMRWNVYTRTLGYVKANDVFFDENGQLDKFIRGIAKVHNDLVTFDELPKEEKDKDKLKLMRDTVDILKSI